MFEKAYLLMGLAAAVLYAVAASSLKAASDRGMRSLQTTLVANIATAAAFLANNPPEVIWNGFQADGFHLKPGTDAEKVLGEVHQAVYGEALRAHVSTGVADVRAYLNYYGIPALCYGPKGEGAHAFDERAHLPSLKRNTVSIAAFIAEWCGTRPA